MPVYLRILERKIYYINHKMFWTSIIKTFIFQITEGRAPASPTSLPRNHLDQRMLNIGDQSVTIVNNIGPSSQLNAHLSICVTYYDDPELIGGTFRPEVFQVESGGLTTFGFTPDDRVTTLHGTGQWREAYFEIPDIKFTGVNQGPQGAARFVFTDKIYFTQIRYEIIRPCGPFTGINPLEECKPSDPPTLSISRNGSGELNIQWPSNDAAFQVESTLDITADTRTLFPINPTTDDGISSVIFSVSETTFFRLIEVE